MGGGKPFNSESAREAGRKSAESRRRKKESALEKIRVLSDGEAPGQIRTIEECADLAGKIPGWVLSGKIDSETARVAVNAVAEARRVIDKAFLAGQLRELQEELARMKREKGRV